MALPKQQNSSDGCLWLFLVAILSVLGFALGKAFLRLADLPAIVIAVVASMFLVSRWFGIPKGKALLKNTAIIIGLLFAIKTAGNFISTVLRDLTPTNTGFNAIEGVSKSTIIEDSDTISVYSSSRTWRDNYGNGYTGNLMVREYDYNRLKNHIDNYKVTTGENFWGKLYKYIDAKDGPSLDLVINTFQEINAEENLNRREFAEMVVSCIQDIPYSLVFQDKCYPAHNYEESIRTILEKCPECCIGNVAFGIQNPVSFLQNLKGDCDTRTVMIYSILKKFGYDVAILNSDFYKHSIIGLNLPSAGLHKKYKGKKYAVWETTNKHFELGYLSPNFDDITHWNVILTSK